MDEVNDQVLTPINLAPEAAFTKALATLCTVKRKVLRTVEEAGQDLGLIKSG